MNTANWIAVAAVLAALLGTGITWYANRRRNPDLDTDVAGNGPLAVGGIETPQGILSQTAPTIDVRLVNSGTGPAVIVGCVVEVVWAHRFRHVRPPVARVDRGGAALLPPSAQYVVVLPSPERATGRSFPGARPGPDTLEAVVRGADGHHLSHELPAGQADRFVVRLEAEPHGGGTAFEHAGPGDDRLVYQVRLLIDYLGGPRKRRLRTEKIGIVAPANELVFPAAGEIRTTIERFRREVADAEDAVNAELRGNGHRALDWDSIRERADADRKVVRGLFEESCRNLRLTPEFMYPDAAVASFLDDLESFCRAVLRDLPEGSDLAHVFFPPARRTLVEIARTRTPTPA